MKRDPTPRMSGFCLAPLINSLELCGSVWVCPYGRTYCLVSVALFISLLLMQFFWHWLILKQRASFEKFWKAAVMASPNIWCGFKLFHLYPHIMRVIKVWTQDSRLTALFKSFPGAKATCHVSNLWLKISTLIMAVFCGKPVDMRVIVRSQMEELHMVTFQSGSVCW